MVLLLNWVTVGQLSLFSLTGEPDFYNYCIICCHLLKKHSLNFGERQRNGDTYILSFLLVSAACQSQGKSKTSRLVDCENVENDNLGPFHPSACISLPFQSVWGNCCPAQGLLVSPYQHKHNSRAHALKGRENAQNTGCTKSTWFHKACACCSNMNVCPRDGLTDFTFWISAFSSTPLCCCFHSPVDVWKQKTSISWRRKRLGRKFCSQNKTGWQKKNATKRRGKKAKQEEKMHNKT